ncbi:MAG: methylenetetrahydrofolate reductase [NAD(P)H] [Ruminococcus sp.]|jgi:methylenetetrahydrofolate reductase (NADPH)|nr:methylenetetrahydrofolate reductase [NAD(P)H] [Ruminococcus sp.]
MKNKTQFSFEIFPPKKTSPSEVLYKNLDELYQLKPDFISVTFGAMGSKLNQSTVDIASRIEENGITSVAHLPCVNFSKQEILSVLSELKEKNVKNILALRGDILPDISPKTDFKYASDLTAFIKENGDFNIFGACYPEVHPEAKNMISDITALKVKVDNGVTHLISQLFYDNSAFYKFIELAKVMNINVPISAGIMPITNKTQIFKIVSMCNAKLPSKFIKIMEKFGDDSKALFDAGIAYAVDQIVDLIANNVTGIHLYTMNNPEVARRIKFAIGNLL